MPWIAWRRAVGPPAASAPIAPARYATALYRPKTLTRAAAGASPIMACSSEVIGPDSLGSVDRVPVIDAMASAGTHEVSANTAPAPPITARSIEDTRRRPRRSPHPATPSED